MDFLYEPTDMPSEPSGFEPLFPEDEEFEDEDEYVYEDIVYEEEDDEDEFIDPSFGGWDDLKPFGSFDGGYGWDEGWL